MNELRTMEENSFAEACYNMNEMIELQECLVHPDETDMKVWNLSESEYKEQIRTALDYLKIRNNVKTKRYMKKSGGL